MGRLALFPALRCSFFFLLSQPLADSRVDFACIDQDDRVLQLAGINSLISCELRFFSSLLFKYAMMMIAEFYAHTDAMRADYVLIPVRPRKQNSDAMMSATHPGQLVEYGERGWCRLESYIFTCLAELRQAEVNCFAFGLRVPARVQDEAIDEEMKFHGMVHSSLKCLPRVSGETLRRLFDTSEGVWFSTQVRVRVYPCPSARVVHRLFHLSPRCDAATALNRRSYCRERSSRGGRNRK